MEHFYAQGLGETRRAYHLLRQSELVSNPESRLKVVFRLYEKRFGRSLDPAWTLDQIQGFEGAAHAHRLYGSQPEIWGCVERA